MIRSYDFFKAEPKRYHFYARCIASTWPLHPMDAVWLTFQQSILELKKDIPFELRSFVAMTNHFHGVVEIRSDLRTRWAQTFEDILNSKFGNSPDLLEDGIHLILIPNYGLYTRVTRYIYRNPVEAGLVRDPIQYPYSTLHQIFREKVETPLPFTDDLGLLFNPRRVF